MNLAKKKMRKYARLAISEASQIRTSDRLPGTSTLKGFNDGGCGMWESIVDSGNVLRMDVGGYRHKRHNGYFCEYFRLARTRTSCKFSVDS